MVDPIRVGHVEKFRQMRWCHVAQAWASTWHPVSNLYGKFKKLVWGSMGFEPTTTHQAQALRNDPTPMHPHMFLVIKTNLNIFKI
jgi:hypothetical protein